MKNRLTYFLVACVLFSCWIKIRYGIVFRNNKICTQQ